MSDGYSSPSAVDTPLEYVSVETYNWPKPAESSRARIDEKERRRRHCECQKRFLARKRRSVTQLRLDVVKLELQAKLLTATREAMTLRAEQDHLLMEHHEATIAAIKPHEAGPLDSVPVDAAEIAAAIQSLDVEGLLVELGLPCL